MPDVDGVRPHTRREDGEPEAPAPRTPGGRSAKESTAERRKRRAQFLRELAEARELRARVQPRRARAQRERQALRMRSFRW
jgi:hypothetical protein